MRWMKSITVVLVAVAMIMTSALPAAAEDSAMKEIFRDALYGGLAGTLIGAATLIFTKKPSDHLVNLAIGGGAGAVAGAGYGVIKTSKALAQFENGRVKFAVPTIMPEVRDVNYHGDKAVVVNAEIFRGVF